MKKILYLALVVLGSRLLAQDQQLIIGATTNVPGATLILKNAETYVTTSGYCFPTVSGSYFDYNISGDPDSYTYPYAGYYYNCIQAFNALPTTESNAGPVTGAAALGTVIQLKLLSAEGPAGASFAFWEVNSDGSFGTNLTWSVPVPSSGDTNLILVTQAPNTPTNDPFGQISHRVFGFSKPGLYKLTWQLVDTSTNGPGGTPLNLPSAPFTLYYQADSTIAGIATGADGVHIKFAAPAGILQSSGFYNMQYYIEQSPTLGADANWLPALDTQGRTNTIVGDDYLHTNTVTPTGTAQFYRLNGTPPPFTN